MASKNGRPELVSLLQYMKNTDLDNPNISEKDERILNLDKIVREVRQSEEWKSQRMSIIKPKRQFKPQKRKYWNDF